MKIKTTLLWIACIILHTAYSQTLQWEELGPANLGGRTRAILIDRRDSTRSTVYAGMVSGGLWKSTDHGTSWHQLKSVYSSSAVSCIAQDVNGRIYFGTGEGLAQPNGSSRTTGSVGNGLHFLYNNDQDSILLSTMPAYLTNTDLWSSINRIAINPNNANEIFAATSANSNNLSGLQRSTDGGLSWTLIGSAAAPISGLTSGYSTASDVKYSADGSIVYASVGLGQGFYLGTKLIVSNDGGNTFAYVNDSFPTNISRIEIGISPSAPLVAYISIATINGFGGIWKTTDGGSSWIEIGAQAGVLNTPFGTNGQGWYDNAIAVSPVNPDAIYFGGIQLYNYTSLTSWTLASIYFGSPSDPNWLSPDIQTLVFNDKDSNELYIGTDGGIFHSTDASVDFPLPNYAQSNSGYNTMQCYSVASDLYGNILTGGQNAGTRLININQGSQVVSSGEDGVYTEISHFDSSVFIAGYEFGEEERTHDRGNTWVPLYDSIIDPYGLGVPSVCGRYTSDDDAPFITAFWLAETKNATNSVSKVPFADNVAHSAGDTVTLTSHIGQPFQETLAAALPAGDTLLFTDRLQSRLYLASSCGLFMTPAVLNFANKPRWFRITASTDDIKSLAASPTGDTIYLGRNSIVTRISGLNSIDFDTISIGRDTMQLSSFPSFQETDFSVTSVGRYIEGVDLDIHDPNHVLCAVSGFSTPGTPHVYVSHDAGATWTSAQSNLPDMPVYQCVIDAYDPTHYIIGTELGFWDSHDAGTTWVEQNAGITVREPVYRLRQQTYLSDQCYMLYAGTHGRGTWRCPSILESQAGCTVDPVYPLGTQQVEAPPADKMLIYPNPMDALGHVVLELSESSDVSLRVMDMTGRVLYETAYSNLVSGKNTFELNTSALANGSYLVSARLSNGQLYTSTMVIAK